MQRIANHRWHGSVHGSFDPLLMGADFVSLTLEMVVTTTFIVWEDMKAYWNSRWRSSQRHVQSNYVRGTAKHRPKKEWEDCTGSCGSRKQACLRCPAMTFSDVEPGSTLYRSDT